jgi:hypothetical protein
MRAWRVELDKKAREHDAIIEYPVVAVPHSDRGTTYWHGRPSTHKTKL